MIGAARRMFEAPNGERNALLGLLLFASLVQTAVILVLPISLSNDSWDYLRFARNIVDSSVLQRTVGFPFLLALTGVPQTGTAIFFVFAQSLMAISLPFMTYFALRPLSRPLAFAAAIVGAATLYPYVMALQVLTEASFVWFTALLGLSLSRYFFTGRVSFLLLAVLATIGIAMVRVSGTAQFACLIFVVAVAAAYAWWRKDDWGRFVRHALLAVLLFGSWHVGYGAVSDRTASNILPFFVFNWVYRGGTEINYGIVSADNGPRTREMLIMLGETIADDPGLYRMLAEIGGAEEVKFIARASRIYDENDVHELLHDIVENNTNPHRGFVIPFKMAEKLGRERAAELLTGAIVEALLAHPEVLVRRTRKAVDSIKNSLQRTPGPVYYVTAFWLQVPKPGLVDRTSGGPILAEWLYGLNLLAGSDPEGRAQTGHFPESLAEAWGAFTQYGNVTALGNYAVFVNTRTIVPVVWVLMLSGLIFGFWSRYPFVALGLVLIGTAPPFASVLISEVDPRHFLMAYPVQLMAAGASVDGALRMIDRFKQRVGASA